MPCFGSHFENGRHPLMVTYHYVKFYVSIIIQLEVININIRNFKFPIGFYSNPHPIWTPTHMALTPLPQIWKLLDQLETYINNSIKFHEILSSSSWDLRGQVHGPRKERRKRRKRIIILIIIIIRNGAKAISLQTLFGRLNYLAPEHDSVHCNILFP
jgi:hypothetical protein